MDTEKDNAQDHPFATTTETVVMREIETEIEDRTSGIKTGSEIDREIQVEKIAREGNASPRRRRKRSLQRLRSR